MKPGLFAAIACLMMKLAMGAPVVSIDPSTLAFHTGDSVSANVLISGLEPNRALGTYDVVVAFDALSLQFVSATFGNQLDLFGLGDVATASTGAGFVELFELSLESSDDLNALQQPSFLMVSVMFTAIADSFDSALGLNVVALGDAEGNSLLPPSGGTIPEPATLWLVLSALLLFAGIRTQRFSTCSRQHPLLSVAASQ